jgi:hypothetical protein
VRPVDRLAERVVGRALGPPGGLLAILAFQPVAALGRLIELLGEPG